MKKTLKRKYLSCQIRLPFFTGFIAVSLTILILKWFYISAGQTLLPAPALGVDEVIKKWFVVDPKEIKSLTSLPIGDAKMTKFIKERLLVPPPDRKPKNLTYNPDPSKGQGKKIAELFKNKTGGFFIECGAMDGYFYSNTLWLEEAFGWTGLLVEPDPDNFAKLLSFGRHAWLAPTCLSPSESGAIQASIKRKQGGYAKIWQMPLNRDTGSIDVLCVPFANLIAAVGVKRIDFFSLDIEGLELDVLRTFPFKDLDITAFAIEFSHIEEGVEELVAFMDEQGYRAIESTEEEEQQNHWAEEDKIFVKKNWTG